MKKRTKEELLEAFVNDEKLTEEEMNILRSSFEKEQAVLKQYVADLHKVLDSGRKSCAEVGMLEPAFQSTLLHGMIRVAVEELVNLVANDPTGEMCDMAIIVSRMVDMDMDLIDDALTSRGNEVSDKSVLH